MRLCDFLHAEWKIMDQKRQKMLLKLVKDENEQRQKHRGLSTSVSKLTTQMASLRTRQESQFTKMITNIESIQKAQSNVFASMSERVNALIEETEKANAMQKIVQNFEQIEKKINSQFSALEET